MKVVFTEHALEKFKALEIEGWHITKAKIYNTIKNPRWTGVTRSKQDTAMSPVNTKHIIRIILRREDDIITIVTFHIARRGRYESTLR